MEKKELSRVPQAMTFDVTALGRTFNEMTPVVQDILIFVANKQMANLFGEVQFTIDDFCKEFGHKRIEMQRTMAQFSDNPKLIPTHDGHKFDGLFEYALYRALKENVVFSRKKGDKLSMEAVNIIQKLEVLYDKSSAKKEKRIYNIKLGHKILDFLAYQYNLIDYNEYKGLKMGQKMVHTGAMRNFYIFMGRMIAKIKHLKNLGEKESFISSIDDICTVFGVKISEAKERKRYVKNILAKIQKELLHTKFEWEFVKNGEKYAYYVEFCFPEETLRYFDEQFKAKFFKELFAGLQGQYIRENGLNVIEIRGIWNEESDKEEKPERWKFMNWVLNEDEAFEEKMKIAKEVYQRTYRVDYTGDLKEMFKNLM
jgi:hypothetical protein